MVSWFMVMAVGFQGHRFQLPHISPGDIPRGPVVGGIGMLGLACIMHSVATLVPGPGVKATGEDVGSAWAGVCGVTLSMLTLRVVADRCAGRLR